MAGPQVIILNGVGSVGKSSLAKAFQRLAAKPWLHVEMDAFLEMMPAHYHDHPDGFQFHEAQEDGEPVIHITTGAVCDDTLRGMRHAVAAMAAQGLHLIVDEVMLGEQAAEYRKLLAGIEHRFVGIMAPLALIEERERQRGDRVIGLARGQFGRIHQGIEYDLEIDASTGTSDDLAMILKRQWDL